jgi:hypothetical protein
VRDFTMKSRVTSLEVKRARHLQMCRARARRKCGSRDPSLSSLRPHKGLARAALLNPCPRQWHMPVPGARARALARPLPHMGGAERAVQALLKKGCPGLGLRHRLGRAPSASPAHVPWRVGLSLQCRGCVDGAAGRGLLQRAARVCAPDQDGICW